MKRVVRPMEELDQYAVLALEQNTPEAPHWNRTEYEFCIAQKDEKLRRTGFIAESENNLLGFAVAKLVTGVCELESIAVVEKVRGQGTGIALMEAVFSWALASGAFRLELEVRASNLRAIRFYERYGLHREGMRRGYYQNPEEDAVLMGMNLASSGKLP